MPRPHPEALVEISCWMEQAHQLQSALAVIDARVARPGAKAAAGRKAAAKKTPTPALPDPGAQ